MDIEKQPDGNQQDLNKIWERIDTNFNNLVALISQLVEEVKKIREKNIPTLEAG
jgi:hypothetical protein